jgi:hypothetical protein
VKSERGLVWALVGVYAVILAVAGWSTVKPGLCENDMFASALASHQAAWCAEFWLNRYQTLIAALMALLVAIGTGALLYRQWMEARGQAAFYRRSILREGLADSAALVKSLDHVNRELRGAHLALESLLSSGTSVDQSTLAAANNHLIEARAQLHNFALTPAERPMIYPLDKIFAYAKAARRYLERSEPMFQGPQINLLLGREKERQLLKSALAEAYGEIAVAREMLLQEIFAGEGRLNREIAAAEAEMSPRLRRPPIEIKG